MRIPHKLSVRAINNGILITAYMTKTELIRKIQRNEGHSPCFRTDEREYCQGCEWESEWESECKNSLIAAWKR